MEKWKKFLALFLALLMLVTMADDSLLTAYAAEIAQETDQKEVTETTKEVKEVTENQKDETLEEITLDEDFILRGDSILSETDYVWEDGVLTILSKKDMVISNVDPDTPTTARIQIAADVSANLTLAGINIHVPDEEYLAAFLIADGSKGNVSLTLAEGSKNILRSGRACAGLQKSGDAASGSLTLQGNGILEVTGGYGGAGIGGGVEGSGSNITINEGVVTATGGDGGAGIGGGVEGSGSNITINEGVVTATGEGGGAGIGGGYEGEGTSIGIKGGLVRATGEYANNIGGGFGKEPTIPTDVDGNPVYPLEIINVAQKAVKIDNKDYPSTHNGGSRLCVYLPAKTMEEPNLVSIGEEIIEYYYQDGVWYRNPEIPTEDTGDGVQIGMDFWIKGTDGAVLTREDYTYENYTLKIHSEKKITIANLTPEEPVVSKILVEGTKDVDLTLAGVNIDVSREEDVAAFEIADIRERQVTIILAENTTNILKSGKNCAGLQKKGITDKLILGGLGTLETEGGSRGAGIGGGNGESGSHITIEGGTVTAMGGEYASGIGGGNEESGSHITIEGGTVTAMGGEHASGIGGGAYKSGSDITINAGIVNAIGNKGGAGIGGGDGGECFRVVITGGIVTATTEMSARGDYQEYGIGGKSCGEEDFVTITGGSVKARGTDHENIACMEGDRGPVDAQGNTLYLLEIINPEKETVKINGKDYPAVHEGESRVYVYLPAMSQENPNEVIVGETVTEYYYADGIWHTNQKISGEYVQIGTAFFIKDTDGSSLTEEDYTYQENLLTIHSRKNITIKNIIPEEAVTMRIQIESPENTQITLEGINIDVSRTDKEAALEIGETSSGEITIILAENTVNILKSGVHCAGLQKHGNASSLTIRGKGSLTAIGGYYGAGIGGGDYGSVSGITISEGVVTATGGEEGAGIGGGYYGSGSEITISGGTVTATGGEEGAGIGGGYYGSGSEITISGGAVTATGGRQGAGIGGGYYGSGSEITIAGGIVTATGGYHGAGIGGGDSGSGSKITIAGGIVTATGEYYGAGIGGGYYGSGSEITVAGGIVTATGGEQGAGIGGGDGADGSHIMISGGYTKATPGKNANSIGGGRDSQAVLPTDGEGNPLYSLEIPNNIGADLWIDGKDYPNAHIYINKDNQIVQEKKLFLYVPLKSETEYYEVSYRAPKTSGDSGEVQEEKTSVKYYYEDSRWKMVLKIPQEDETTYIYNKRPQTYQIEASDYYKITGRQYTNAGNYTVVVSLKQKENMVWEDNTNEDRIYDFEIRKKTPVFDKTSLPMILGTYGQSLADMELTETTAISDNEISGSFSITESGKETIFPVMDTTDQYQITFTPEDMVNYEMITTETGVQVEPKELTIQNIIAENRRYDVTNPENKMVTITSMILEGVVGEEQVSVDLSKVQGMVENSAAGTYRTVTLSMAEASQGNLFLTGKDAGNYILPCPTTPVPTNEAGVTIEKVNSQITILKDYYEKTYGDEEFFLEGITDNNPETEVTYTTEGKGVVGVSEDGKVTILKAGEEKITVHLEETTNYQKAESKEITVQVAKAKFTAEEIYRTYVYVKDTADIIDIKELLPEDCGEIIYQKPATEGNLRYRTAPVISEGILEYTVGNGTIGTTGTITQVVETENYQDIIFTINLELTNQIPVMVKEGQKVTLSSHVLTYGEPLSKLTFEKVVFVEEEGTEVAGTLTWKAASLVPGAGTTSAEWVFTPEDTTYQTLEGNVGISVEKATPVIVTITASDITLGESLGVSLLKGRVQHSNTDTSTVSGTFAWKNVNTKPKVTNSNSTEYEVIFTPTDNKNYNIVTGKVKLVVNEIAGDQKPDQQKPDQQKPTKQGTEFKDAKGIYQFRIQEDGKVLFTGVAKSIKTVKIADTVTYAGKTWKVTGIAAKALKGDKIVTTVAVGKNVKTIGASAFEGCEKLTKVTLKNQVTTIGNKVFKQCKSLKKITIPKKVTKLGKSVFEGCKKLSNITIKATGLKKVGKNTFQGIAQKAKIKVPKKNQKAYQKLLKNKGQGKKVTVK